MRPTANERKTVCIRDILDNPVYTTESAMYQRLDASLRQLSALDLSDLATVIKCGRKVVCDNCGCLPRSDKEDLP